MTAKLTMHAARMMMNRDQTARDWAEDFLKARERESFMRNQPDATEEAFKKHWLYVKPERMHEGAIEAVSAYIETKQQTTN